MNATAGRVLFSVNRIREPDDDSSGTVESLKGAKRRGSLTKPISKNWNVRGDQAIKRWIDAQLHGHERNYCVRGSEDVWKRFGKVRD